MTPLPLRVFGGATVDGAKSARDPKMQFQIEELGTIKKRVRVEVPSRKVDSTFSQVYNSIAQKVSLPGFRRGRVPMSHLRKRYGIQATTEVAQKLIEAGWRAMLDDHGLVPLSEPELDGERVQQGKDYIFTLTFEVAPKVELKAYDDLTVEKINFEASDDIVAQELSNIAEHYATYEVVADREEAQDGDMVVFDYAGTVEGEAFDGGTAQDAELVLGSGRFIPGFEEQLVGKKVGTDFDVEVSFPADYPAPHLAGQAAVFACTLKSVKVKVVPAVDDALAEKMGEANLEDLKAKTKTEVENRHNEQALNETRDQLREALGQQYGFECPPSLLDGMIQEKRNQRIMNLVQSGTERDEAEKAVEGQTDEIEAEALSYVRANLVIDTIADEQKVEITEKDIDAHIDEIAAQMGPYGFQLRQMYAQGGRRSGLRRKLKEDKVLDFLLTEINVTSVTKPVPEHDSGQDDHEGE